MTYTEQCKLNRIVEQGEIVAVLRNNGNEARIYAVEESRGYQTQYQLKRFFYFVPLNNLGIPIYYQGITKDCRRHDFANRCKTQGTTVKIVNSNLFNEWLKR